MFFDKKKNRVLGQRQAVREKCSKIRRRYSDIKRLRTAAPEDTSTNLKVHTKLTSRTGRSLTILSEPEDLHRNDVRGAPAPERSPNKVCLLTNGYTRMFTNLWTFRKCKRVQTLKPRHIRVARYVSIISFREPILIGTNDWKD